MIALGSDHAGFALKEQVKEYLEKLGLAFNDMGCYSAESVDYPVFAAGVAKAVSAGEAQLGILICGTGIGVSIMANRHAGIRAALCTNELMARMSRAHNDANVLVLGANIIAAGLAQSIIDEFLKTPFDGGRHSRRIAMFDDTAMLE